MINRELLDTVLFLKENLREGLRERITRIWYNDDTWPAAKLPLRLSTLSSSNKRIIYLRKKIYIPPRLVTSDFTIRLGYIPDNAEIYFNQEMIRPELEDKVAVLTIPDTLIKTYSNLLFLRVFMKDSNTGLYGSEFLCHNQDSSFYRNIEEEWKYNTGFEADFPEYTLQTSGKGLLYEKYIKHFQDENFEEVLWYGGYQDLDDIQNLEPKIRGLLNYFTSANKKSILKMSLLPVDTILHPGVNQKLDSLSEILSEKGIGVYIPHTSDQ
jgi:hypothetical protein